MIISNTEFSFLFQTLNFKVCTQHKSEILSEKIGNMWDIPEVCSIMQSTMIQNAVSGENFLRE